MAQFRGRNETVVVAIEDLERFPDFLLGIGVLHLARHHGKKFYQGELVCQQPFEFASPLNQTLSHTGKVNCAIVISINLVNHVLQLRLGGVLAQRTHNGTQLLGGDLACTFGG